MCGEIGRQSETFPRLYLLEDKSIKWDTSITFKGRLEGVQGGRGQGKHRGGEGGEMKMGRRCCLLQATPKQSLTVT